MAVLSLQEEEDLHPVSLLASTGVVEEGQGLGVEVVAEELDISSSTNMLHTRVKEETRVSGVGEEEEVASSQEDLNQGKRRL